MTLEDVTTGAFGNRDRPLLEGFQPRLLQTAMAARIARAIESGGCYLFEAGTGVGKSLAYIVPAVLSGRKCIISTATKTLQDQLFLRDIPEVLRNLGSPVSSSVLKGRGNYLCARKLEAGLDLGLDDRIGRWASTTSTGDVQELDDEPDPRLWARIRSDAMDCLGQACPKRGACFLTRARAEARRAGIVIVNHHLLMSAVRGDDVLPEAGVLVADEGHRLEDAAAECLGYSLFPGMMVPVFDGIAWSSADVGVKAALLASARGMQAAIEEITGTEGGVDSEAWDPGSMEGRMEDLASQALVLAGSMSGVEDLAAPSAACRSIAESARAFIEAGERDLCTFRENGGGRPRLRAVPLDPGALLGEGLYPLFGTVVITSATLAVGGDFGFSCERLGITSPEGTCDFGSPFDYGSQALLSCPEGLPDPDDHQSIAEAAWRWGRDLASELGGRTMLLFTSFRNLTLAVEEARRAPLPGVRLLVQGESTRRWILDSFRADPCGIVMGTASFWEGVDLPGEILQALVIDRLPFPSPGHPYTLARMKRIEASGGSSFFELMLPSAVIRLRQGVGRLIRSRDDRGVVVILDRRLSRSSYGRLIVSSLPAFRYASAGEALEFASSISTARGR